MKRARVRLARLARIAMPAVLGAVLTAPAGALAFEVVAQVISPALVELRLGETRLVAIEVVVKPGYHVQANPAAQPFLIPTTLTLVSAPGVTVGTPRYPAPKRLRLAGSGEELLVYDRRFVIVVPVTHAQRGAATLRLEGRLGYQGCDDRRCFFPRVAPVAPIALVLGGSPARGRSSSPSSSMASHMGVPGTGGAVLIDGTRRGNLAHPADHAAKANPVRVF